MKRSNPNGHSILANMRQPTRTVIVLSLSVLAAGVIFCRTHEREPIYAGKPISHWITICGQINDPNRPSSFEALPQFDSNAVPFFVKALEKQDNLFSRAYERKWLALPPELRSRLPAPTSAQEARWKAIRVLMSLGGAAQPALPSLQAAMRHDSSLEVRVTAMLAVSYIADAETFTTAMCEALNDDSPFVRARALSCLKRRALDAQGAVPALVKCLADEDWTVRRNATNTLKAIETANPLVSDRNN